MTSARRILATLVVVALVAACAGDDDGDGDASATTATSEAATSTTPTSEAGGCRPARPHEPGTSTVTVTSSGLERTATLYVPPGYNGRRPTPLVLNIHGFGSNAGQQIVYSDMAAVADREGFLMVAPEGQGTPQHFNLIGVRPGEGDDVVFVNDLLDRVEAELCVDERRIFSTGISNGGGLTSILACRAADRIAAFVAVALVLHLGCDPGRPVPIAAFHGELDPVVPYAGGKVNCCGNPTVPDMPGQMRGWAAHAGCDPDPIVAVPSPQVRIDKWVVCEGGVNVVFWTIVGGGHTWPGSPIDVERLGLTTHEVSASEEAWRFFEAHPLPA